MKNAILFLTCVAACSTGTDELPPPEEIHLQLTFRTTPPGGFAGEPLETITVVVQDPAGRHASGADREVTLSARREDGRELVLATKTSALGVVEFEQLVIEDAGRWFWIAGAREALEGRSELFEIRRRDRAAPIRLTAPSGGEWRSATEPSISRDGSTLVFLGVLEDTTPSAGIYSWRQNGAPEWISYGPDGVLGNNYESGGVISADGTFLAFNSGSTNYVEPDASGLSPDAFGRDLERRTTELIGILPSNEAPGSGSHVGDQAISADNRLVIFQSRQTSTSHELYLRDRRLRSTLFIAPETNGAAISGDGRAIAFDSYARLTPDDNDSFSDVFLWERGSISRISRHSNGRSHGPRLSEDGNIVAFTSDASTLIEGDTNGVADVFVFERESGLTHRASVGDREEQAAPDTGGPATSPGSALLSISADGRYVLFRSAAGNLVPGDTNGFIDIFVRDRRYGRTERVSAGEAGVEGEGISWDGEISGDGRYVVFSSEAPNLVPGDTNRNRDVFLIANPLAD